MVPVEQREPPYRARHSGARSALTAVTAQSLRLALRRARHYGRGHYCPLCRSRVRRFGPFGSPPRPDVVCPVCGAFDRHRFAWRLLLRRGLLEAPRRLRLLHVAPETQLERAFRGLGTLDYVSTDISSPRATVRADLTALPFADGSFDAVFCSHVLEHVEDDRRAMTEIRRVTRRSGWALFMVPLFPGETVEDPEATTPAARLALYGKSDHVRMYGELDFPARLGRAGFDVETVSPADVVSQGQARLEGIPAGTRAFLAR
jgi:SAM-dependent methyltransferase